MQASGAGCSTALTPWSTALSGNNRVSRAVRSAAHDEQPALRLHSAVGPPAGRAGEQRGAEQHDGRGAFVDRGCRHLADAVFLVIRGRRGCVSLSAPAMACPVGTDPGRPGRQAITEGLREEMLTEADVQAQRRLSDVCDMRPVRCTAVKPNGKLSVQPRNSGSCQGCLETGPASSRIAANPSCR